MSTCFSFSTADTWDVKVDYSVCINYLHNNSSFAFNNVFVPGCGRGRFVYDLILSMKESQKVISFFCVDSQENELENFIKRLKDKGFSSEKPKYSSNEHLNHKNLNVYFYANTVQDFLCNNELKFDLIIALLFFHYVPDAWASILFDMLKHLNKDGIFVFDKIVGADPENDEIMSVMDASLPTRTTLSTIFSAEQSTSCQAWKDYFAEKLLKRSIFWNSTIKATDVDEISHCLIPLFYRNYTVDSGEFTPVFSGKHVPWCWGENIAQNASSILRSDLVRNTRPTVKYKFYIFKGFLQTDISFWQSFFYENATQKAIVQFDSIPWILKSYQGKKFSIRDAIVFSQNILPQCMMQTIASSGLFSSSSEIVNLFLCFNSPIQSSSVVNNLCYIVNEFCTSSHENANRFIANAAYHACVTQQSLSNIFFEKEKKTIILSTSRIKQEILATMEKRYSQEGFQIEKITTGKSPELKTSYETSLGFLMHWGLGNNVDVKQIRNEFPFKADLETYGKEKKKKQSKSDSPYAPPLEIMDLDAVIFVPFVGFQTVSDSYSISSNTHPFCGLGIGIHCASEQSIDETLRIVHLVSILVTRLMDAQLTLHWALQTEITSLQSAVSAIMSRNGSHNIGSHVLSALSHNVGTMPDDRILYQYIQHRMDYIATITTEFPSWSSPTLFVGEIMKEFFSQHHLLEYIAKSEGLSAFHFQDHNMTRQARAQQKNTIKIFVRRIQHNEKNSNSKNSASCIDKWDYAKAPKYNADHFIDYSADKTTIELSKDVLLAIPGGVVGRHAFFTILENIIRNAAKHGWASGKRLPNETNLEVFVDFIDEPSMDKVEFTIWDNMSNVFHSFDHSAIENSKETTKEILEKLGVAWTIRALLKPLSLDKIDHNEIQELLAIKSFLPLHWQQQLSLAQPLIEGNGVLRKENWGLAEMRISAGYLNHNTISEIGGLDVSYNSPSRTIILPVAIPGICRNPQNDNVGIMCDLSDGNFCETCDEHCPLKNRRFHLGYRFSIPKPKQILIVVSSDDINRIKKIDEYKKNGIYFRTLEDVEKFNDYGYEYVVIQKLEENRHPSRVVIQNYNDILEKAKSSGDDIGLKSSKIKNIVFKAWIDHLKNIRQDIFAPNDTRELEIGLCVNTSSGSEKDFISDADIFNIVFLNCFRAIVEELERDNHPLATALHILSELSRRAPLHFSFSENVRIESDEWDSVRKIISDKLKQLCGIIEKDCECFKNDEENILSASDIKDIQEPIKRYLSSYCNPTYRPGKPDALADYANDLTKLKERIKHSSCSRATKSLQSVQKLKKDIQRGKRSLILKRLSYSFATANSLLRKSAEEIVPLSFSVQKGATEQSGQSPDPSKYSDLGVNILFNLQNCCPAIRYQRHLGASGEIEINTSDIYAEGLSGSQSYLEQLSQLQNKQDAMLVTHMIENALLRILIIDERMCNFLSGRKDIIKVFSAMGIWVVDVNRFMRHQQIYTQNNNEDIWKKIVDDELSNSSMTEEEKDDIKKKLQKESEYTKFFNHISTAKLTTDALLTFDIINFSKYQDGFARSNTCEISRENSPLKDFDILIIHQGIIDKWLSNNAEEDVKNLLDWLQKQIPYVVVTTGRGNPANIPESAHLLPFACIEGTLFKRYPEKMTLVNTIMNIFPGERSKQ